MKNSAWGKVALWFLLGLTSAAGTTAAQAAPTLVVDGDNDGVSDEIDDCPYTPPNTPVDARGCPVAGDADGDGVPDSMDMCPYTPKGALVDAQGCALDSDLDGVPDGLDLCPHTPFGERVDSHGCEPGSVIPKTAEKPAAPGLTPKAAARPKAAAGQPAHAPGLAPSPAPIPTPVPAPSLQSPSPVPAVPPSAPALSNPAEPVLPRAAAEQPQVTEPAASPSSLPSNSPATPKPPPKSSVPEASPSKSAAKKPAAAPVPEASPPKSAKSAKLAPTPESPALPASGGTKDGVVAPPAAARGAAPVVTLSPHTPKADPNPAPAAPAATTTIPAESPPPAQPSAPPVVQLKDREPSSAPRQPSHGGGVVIVETLGAVRFGANTDTVSDNDQQRLQRLVDEVVPRLATMPDSGLYLTGFLKVGEPAGLDQRRAEKVRVELTKRGIPASRIQMAETVSAARKDANAQTVSIQLTPLR